MSKFVKKSWGCSSGGLRDEEKLVEQRLPAPTARVNYSRLCDGDGVRELVWTDGNRTWTTESRRMLGIIF